MSFFSSPLLISSLPYIVHHMTPFVFPENNSGKYKKDGIPSLKSRLETNLLYFIFLHLQRSYPMTP